MKNNEQWNWNFITIAQLISHIISLFCEISALKSTSSEDNWASWTQGVESYKKKKEMCMGDKVDHSGDKRFSRRIYIFTSFQPSYMSFVLCTCSSFELILRDSALSTITFKH